MSLIVNKKHMKQSCSNTLPREGMYWKIPPIATKVPLSLFGASFTSLTDDFSRVSLWLGFGLGLSFGHFLIPGVRSRETWL